MAARGDYGGDLKPRHSWAVQTPTPDEDDKRGKGPPPKLSAVSLTSTLRFCGERAPSSRGGRLRSYPQD